MMERVISGYETLLPRNLKPINKQTFQKIQKNMIEQMAQEKKLESLRDRNWFATIIMVRYLKEILKDRKYYEKYNVIA